MDWLFAILDASWTMFVLAAPYILFGLAFAGLIHVLLPESLVVRWMGTPGLSGVVRAALIGVPLPVCSCGVVPITLELRRKGASRPASQSFLITTPESSIDSIFLTWGMMGPVMAIARPIAAFFTAVLGGILSIASARTVDELVADRPARPALDHDDESCHSHDHGPDHGHDHHGHDHHGHDHHDHDHSVAFAGSGRARLVLLRAFGFGRRPEPQSQLGAETGSSGPETGNETIEEAADGRERAADSVEKGPAAAEAVDAEPGAEPAAESEEVGLWRDLLRPAARYGFGELLDDLAFWLVVGVGLAGVRTALLPDTRDEMGLGTGLLPMIGLLVIGIPLYMCASASTPIAAALLLKGFSPGAALVFLLAGPATNAATVLLLAATFGRRFVQIYVISVAAGALACGLLLDLVLGDVDVAEGLRPSVEEAPGGLTVFLALLLAALLVRSLMRGAWASGVDELRRAFGRIGAHLPGGVRPGLRPMAAVGLVLLLVAYLLGGLRVVPTGSRGYGFLFGALVRTELEPGLHYLPPAPFGRWEVRQVSYPRKSDVGFRTDLVLVDRRRELVGRAPRDDWHSPVAAMNPIPAQASYLTGDGSLVEVSFSVHYTLTDGQAFFYGIDHGRDFVNLYAEAVARELIAGLALDELLTERRLEIEGRILDGLQGALSEQGLGIEVLAVRIVDLHPPGAAVFSFRDVSSAKEDRETAIHHARAEQARTLPLSRGAAAERIAEAEAQSWRRQQEAQGESRSFLTRAAPFAEHRELLGHLLWIETMERTLAGREKLILPPDKGSSSSRGITLWRNVAPPLPDTEKDHR